MTTNKSAKTEELLRSVASFNVYPDAMCVLRTVVKELPDAGDSLTQKCDATLAEIDILLGRVSILRGRLAENAYEELSGILEDWTVEEVAAVFMAAQEKHTNRLYSKQESR